MFEVHHLRERLSKCFAINRVISKIYLAQSDITYRLFELINFVLQLFSLWKDFAVELHTSGK